MNLRHLVPKTSALPTALHPDSIVSAPYSEEPRRLMVPVTGLEPVRCRQRWILSPLRLPIPSHRPIQFTLYKKPRQFARAKFHSRPARKSQAFIAHKFSPFILSNFNMTIWPPSIPLVGSLRFPLLCSSCPLQFPPFSHVSHTAYADSPISRKQARKATSLLIYPSIFRG